MESALNICPAGIQDLESVVTILDAARARLLAAGIDQWRKPFPRRRLESSVKKGELFVARLGETMVATWRLLATDPEVWPEDQGEALYLHTLAVDPTRRGGGLGAQVISWCRTEVARRGRSWLRLDCMAENPGLNAFYASLGFQRRDEKTVDGFSCRRWEIEV